MRLDFNKYAMKGNEFLNRLEENLGGADRAHASTKHGIIMLQSRAIE